MRLFLATTFWSLSIVAAAAFWLFYAIPSHGAEPCRGQLVTVSWYGKETCHGRPPGRGRGFCQTASGLPFDGSQQLVAHRTLPFGTRVRFSYHGRSIVLTVLDRGPFVAGRSFDLSRAAAVRLGTIKAGAPVVCAEILR